MAEPATHFNHIMAADVGKEELVFFILPGKRRLAIANKPKAIKTLLRREQRRNQADSLGAMLLVCEPTGGYEKKLLKIACQLEIAAMRACGRRVRAFARAMGRFAKTDKIDAELLARFALKADKLLLYSPPSPAEARLAQLVARRSDLLDMLGAERNRCEQACDPRVVQSLKRTGKLLRTEIKAISAEIEQVIQGDRKLAHKASLLNSFKGVGPATTATLLAFMTELGTLSKGEIAALAGLAPFNNDSALSSKPRHIHAGRAQVRKVLFMVAMVAVRHNKAMRAVHQRLQARAKPYKVAITAVMRKIIVILNAIIKADQPWKGAQSA